MNKNELTFISHSMGRLKWMFPSRAKWWLREIDEPGRKVLQTKLISCSAHALNPVLLRYFEIKWFFDDNFIAQNSVESFARPYHIILIFFHHSSIILNWKLMLKDAQLFLNWRRVIIRWNAYPSFFCNAKNMKMRKLYTFILMRVAPMNNEKND